jgi:MFS transporter, FSR family, fosmidomycin resistance protein
MEDGPSVRNAFNLKVLLILFLGHLVTDIYQGALPAILPFLKERLALSYTMTGAILMAANLTSSVIQPLFGWIADRKEKALFLPLGCLAAGVGLSLLSLPSSYVPVLFLVIVSGLGVASFHPEGYRTAHFFTGEKMATGMAIFAVGGNLGFALGPIVSIFIITRLGFAYLPSMAIFSLVFLSLLLFSWTLIAVPRTASQSGRQAAPQIKRAALISLFMVIATVVMRSWATMALITYIPFYYIDHLSGDPLYAGSLVSSFLLGGVVGTLGGSMLADRWGHKRYVILSMAMSTLLFPSMFFVEGPALFIALTLLGMVLISSFGVTVVMAQQILPRHLGMASGLMVGFAIGTGGIGVTALGAIADSFGVPVALKCIGLLPLVGFLLSLTVRYPVR